MAGKKPHIRLDIDRLKKDPLYFIRHQQLGAMRLSDKQVALIKSIDANSGRRYVIKAGRRWGKTSLFSAFAVWYAFTKPKVRVGIIAPSWDQCETFVSFVNRIIEQPLIKNSLAVNKIFTKFFSNGSMLTAKVASQTSQGIRGSAFDLIIYEEAAFIPDAQMAVIRPTGLDSKALEIMISTPLGHNHFYRSFNSELFQSFSFKTIDNPIIDSKRLEEEKELMTETEFKQEYEAEFIDDKYNVFPQELIERSIDGNLKNQDLPEEDKSYYMGVDLGRKRDCSVICILEQNSDFVKIVHLWEKQNDFETSFWTQVLDQVEYLAKRFQVKKICIDQTGIGDKPTLDLQQTFSSKQINCVVEGVNFTHGLKNSFEGLLPSLIWKFERYQISIPNHPKLIRQLSNVRFELTKAGNKIYTLTSKDYVAALALSVRALPYSQTSDFFYSLSNPLERREGKPLQRSDIAVSYPA